jgi:hypothetical protein
MIREFYLFFLSKKYHKKFIWCWSGYTSSHSRISLRMWVTDTYRFLWLPRSVQASFIMQCGKGNIILCKRFLIFFIISYFFPSHFDFFYLLILGVWSYCCICSHSRGHTHMHARTHTCTHTHIHSVGLLWTSNLPVAETSTGHQTTLTVD